MATIDSKEAIDRIIARNGDPPVEEPSEPPAVKIVEYTNMAGRITWGVVWENEVAIGTGNRYEIPTPYVRNPHVIWTRDITVAGGGGASQTPTPHAIICVEHGKVYLTAAAYTAQLSMPYATWHCPTCGRAAQWDDANYESYLSPDGSNPDA